MKKIFLIFSLLVAVSAPVFADNGQTTVNVDTKNPVVIKIPSLKTDVKDSDKKDAEVKDSDKKDAEVKDGDKKDAEVKDGDKKDTEVKDGDKKDTEVKDGDNKDTEVKDGDKKDTEAKDGDKKDTEVKDGDKKDADVKDGDNKDAEVKDGDKKDTEVKDGDKKDTEVKDGDKKIDSTSDDFVLPPSGTSLRRAQAFKIVEKMKNVNKGLKDYTCPINATVKTKYSFLAIPFNLEGDYYFKEPDHYKVEFKKAPDFLSKYPSAFGWSLPDPNKYTMKIFDGDGDFTDCFILRMIPIEGRGDLQKIDMYINKTTWLFPRQIYTYQNGGEVDIRCSYRDVKGFKLFGSMEVEANFPKMGIKATGNASYGYYKINTDLPDEIFIDKKK